MFPSTRLEIDTPPRYRVTLTSKKRKTSPRPVIFGGDFEAKLLKLACSESPEGHARWPVRLLADKLVDLKIVPTVFAMTGCSTFF
ncbi:MAG: hypothetical protein A2020_10185 [Lentisphaerae bacterium GWF2_45_14]|nr:MAG: hypothetical protein A2020_10185 [Lentisphaerae bacterium GWF2_45_14]